MSTKGYEQPASARLGRIRPILYVLSTLVVVAIWHFSVEILDVSSLVLPAPADVARALVEFAGPIWEATLVTVWEVLLGFGLAAIIGFLIAIAISYSSAARAIIYPPLLVINAIPKLAIAPLLLIWFGFGLTSKVVVALLIAFFPIVIQVAIGFRTVDPELHDLARSLHASWARTFWKIDLPHALPNVFAGLKVGVTLAVTGAIVGEFLASDSGLGYLVRSAASQQITDLAFAVVLVISAVSIGLFAAIAGLEWLAVPWMRAPSETSTRG